MSDGDEGNGGTEVIPSYDSISVAGRFDFPYSLLLAVVFLSAVDNCHCYTQHAVAELESDWTYRHRALSTRLLQSKIIC